MKLKKLLKVIPEIIIKGSKEIEITGICSNSKIVSPGNLFIAKKGLTYDGAKYIPEAIEGGAIAILTDLYDPTYKDMTQLITPDVNELEAILAAEYHGNPSKSLTMIGITGTNGKTTVSYLVKNILDRVSGPTGLIGTVEYIIGEHKLPATHTTPDVTLNHKLLHEMVLSGCKSAVMEVTSHALIQNRVSNIYFDVAVFTNLSQDHLDFHGTMEEYRKAKNLLFRNMRNGSCVINVDDPAHDEIMKGCSSTVLTYGIEKEADLRAENIVYADHTTSFDLVIKTNRYLCKTPLPGKYNVYNCLAAFGVGLTQQIPIEKLLEIAQTFPQVRGRLEQIPNETGTKIFVDFAHTEDALKNILLCLKEMPHRKIITIFGCGGNRDKTKRPRMAKIAEQLSDVIIVTSDNPRNENPEDILDDIIAGFSGNTTFLREVDRKIAFEKAMEIAEPGDILLIAGKGHESGQIFAHNTVEFNDALVIKEVCSNLLPQHSN